MNNSIWQRCDVSNVDKIVYVSRWVSSLNLATEWRNSLPETQLLTLIAILALQGEKIEWDKKIGFHIDERLQPLGWLVLAANDEAKIYAQIGRGRETSDLYLLITDDMSAYVADYGGSNSWHVRCGGWRINNGKHENL